MRRVAPLLIALALALVLSSGPAVAQDGGGDAFGPLPQPTPAPAPTVEAPPSVEAQKETDRTLLFGIGGALVLVFVVIGRFITRDARRTLGSTDGARAAPQLRDQGPHRHARQSKSKARAKAKAQRAARRQNR